MRQDKKRVETVAVYVRISKETMDLLQRDRRLWTSRDRYRHSRDPLFLPSRSVVLRRLAEHWTKNL